jgi:hypothetical protein
MLFQTSGLVLLQSLQAIWFGLMSYLPAIIVALIIFIIGCVLAHLVGKSIKHLIDLTRVDSVIAKTGVSDMFSKSGHRYSTGSIVGFVVKWALIAVFLVAVVNFLGLSELSAFMQQLFGFLLNVVVAAVIVLLASVIAKFVSHVVAGAARSAGLHAANLAGSIAKWAIWIFALLIVLSQLGIAAQLVQIIFIGIVAMLALAGGLAFGLGGRDHASRVLSDMGKMISKE